MSQLKPNTVFLSFAKPDRALAEKLKDLFESVFEKVYFAPENLRRSPEGQKWRDHVLQGITKSSCFVPIYTRHSVRRPWVLFESGAAEALGLKRFPVRTADVSMDEIELIGKDVTVFDLFKQESLTDFVANVCIAHRPRENPGDFRQQIERQLRDNRHLNAILELSQTRWIFVAGSLPTELRGDPELQRGLRSFVKKMTLSLLRMGFSIASCPQVEDVGKVVSTAYLDFRLRHPSHRTKYRIGGLYPVDLFAREEPDLTGDLQAEWKRHLHEFRKSYLADVEWLILLGGNVGTQEEYEAAQELGVKVLPVPFFGGSTQRLWKRPGAFFEGRPFDTWREGEPPEPPDSVSKYLQGGS